jgi:hypothetical protein
MGLGLFHPIYEMEQWKNHVWNQQPDINIHTDHPIPVTNQILTYTNYRYSDIHHPRKKKNLPDDNQQLPFMWVNVEVS